MASRRRNGRQGRCPPRGTGVAPGVRTRPGRIARCHVGFVAARWRAGLLSIDLKDEASRAAAERLFREIITWADVASRTAAANLSAADGARLIIAPSIESVQSRAYTPKVDYDGLEYIRTDKVLDVAPMQPNHYFQITFGDEVRYTSTGRFFLRDDYALVTQSNYSVMGKQTLAPSDPEEAASIRTVHIDSDFSIRGILIHMAGTKPPVAEPGVEAGAGTPDAPEDRTPTTVRKVQLPLYQIDDPSKLIPELRQGQVVFRLADDAPEPVKITASSDAEGGARAIVRPGYLLVPRRAPVEDAALVDATEFARETALAALKAISRAKEQMAALAKQAAGDPAPVTRSLTVLGKLGWSISYLSAVKQPMQGGEDRVVLDVTDEEAAVRNLMGALSALRTRLKISLENIANAEVRKPELYRKRSVVVGENGALRIDEDTSEPRKLYLPEHPDKNKDGFVLFPNVYVAVEYNEAVASVREYNLLRLAVMHMTSDVIIPELPLPPQPSAPAASTGAEPRKE